MGTHFLSWSRLIRPNPRLSEPAERRLSSILASLLISLTAVFLSLNIFLLVFEDDWAVSPVVILCFGLYFLAYISNRYWRYDVASVITIAAVPVAVHGLIATGNSLDNNVTISYLLIGTVLSALFLNTQMIIIYTVVNNVITLVLPVVAVTQFAGSVELIPTVAVQILVCIVVVAWLQLRERAEAERLASLRILQRINSQGWRANSVMELADSIRMILLDELQFEYLSLNVVNDETDIVERVYLWSEIESDMQVGEKRLLGDLPFFAAVLRQGVIFAGDVAELMPESIAATKLHSLGYKKNVMLRIYQEDVAFALLSLASMSDADEFVSKGGQLLEQLADPISRAFSKVWLSQNLAEQTKKLNALLEIESALNEADTVTEVARVALEQIETHIPGSFLTALLVNYDNETALRLTSMPEALQRIVNTRPSVIPVDDLFFYDQLVTGEIASTNDFGPLAETDPIIIMMLEAGIRHLAVLPLMHDKTLVGVIDIASFDHQGPSPEQLAFVGALSQPLGASFVRARLSSDRLQQAERLRLLNQLSEQIIVDLDVHSVAQVVVDFVASTLETDMVTLQIFDEDKQVATRLLAWSRYPSEFRTGDVIAFKDLAFLDQLRNEDIVIIPDAMTVNGDSKNLKYTLKSGLRSLLILPLKYGSRLIGNLGVAKRVAESFSEREIELIREMMIPVAIALVQAELVSNLQRRTYRLRALNDISRAILTATSPRAIAGTVLATMQQLVPSERSSVTLLDADEAKTISLAAFLNGKQVADEPFPDLYEAVKRHLAAEPGGPVIDRDLAGSELLNLTKSSLHKSGVASVLMVPMRLDGQLIGRIALGSNRENAFAERDVEIVEEMAPYLAIAIRQSQLRALTEASEEQLRQLNEELENRVALRTAELEVANQELEAFSYTVSHDLRAPLRHIDGYVRLLVGREADNLDKTSKRYLETISAASNSMGQLIDDLLSFSRIGKVALSYRPVDMYRVVTEVWKEIAATTGPEVQFTVSDLPNVEADTGLMKVIWSNLIGNAVKYSAREEQPVIAISEYQGAEVPAGHVAYKISDNGVGFDEAYAHKLFGVFDRLHKSEEFSGTGIGLATVHRILLRHQGEIWAESQVGEGATFYFRMPAKSPGERGNAD